MIANARMYSIAPAAGRAWQRLLGAISEAAGVRLSYVDHPPPAPISELWGRRDLGAVFMCGLPYSRSVPRPSIVAAPVPAGPGFQSQPQYWSELVVRADSRFGVVQDTFGHRIALIAMESQSGCLAALYYLMAFGAGGVAVSRGHRAASDALGCNGRSRRRSRRRCAHRFLGIFIRPAIYA